MVGIYLSGTGNTKHCLEKLLLMLDSSAELVPMGNLKVENGKAISLDKCAMCYRCISSCPKQAITLLGKVVVEQCRYEKFVQTENKRQY